jgi:hypothetical protein
MYEQADNEIYKLHLSMHPQLFITVATAFLLVLQGKGMAAT